MISRRTVFQQHVRLASIVSMITVFLLPVAFGSIEAAESTAWWQQQWDATLKAARKEGTVSIYFWQGGNLEKVIQAFQKKYPDIQLSSVGGRGSTFKLLILLTYSLTSRASAETCAARAA